MMWGMAQSQQQCKGCCAGSDDKYLKIMCTEGCVIFYHYACWRAFERFFKASHPDFSWKVTPWVPFCQQCY